MNYLESGEERLIHNDTIFSTAPSASAVSETRRGSGVLGIIFLMVNATLGAGLLNFPQAFDKAGGVGTAIIGQLGFLIMITAALVILAHCSDVTNTSSMQNTFAGLCGSKSIFVCGICVAVYSFGCCVTFLIIIGDQFDRVLATFYGPSFCHNWYLSRPFITTLTCSIFILPLSFVKRLDVLRYTSSIGCITIIYVIWLIIYESITDTGISLKPMQIWPDNWMQTLQIIPIICFAYQSHMTVIPTYACMKDRNLDKFTFCAVISMIICFLAYTIVGIIGYGTFGIGRVPSDILQGYTDKSIFLTIAIISIAIKNFTTYPIVLFCGRDALLSLFGRDTDNGLVTRVFVTLIWFTLSLIIAILVPDISSVINLLGSLSAAFIFLFPGICLLQSTLLKDPNLCLNKDKIIIIIAIFITALGAFVAGVVFVEALQDLSKESIKPPLVTGFTARLRDNLCV
ncbi:putative sodium-coupled neutral amino acid transporter 7 [Cephus cinctus]|uniref:Sodium-coupled neutral amino acid transporter 7 n=1 Tax=Cephus cinctus TaxID=211228 RepID=A0AAJ7FCD4_CEPCN|nr:putative sodium-coupled neutral amino acid transporter 7 [Cephus cinctus]